MTTVTHIGMLLLFWDKESKNQEKTLRTPSKKTKLSRLGGFQKPTKLWKNQKKNKTFRPHGLALASLTGPCGLKVLFFCFFGFPCFCSVKFCFFWFSQGFCWFFASLSQNKHKIPMCVTVVILNMCVCVCVCLLVCPCLWVCLSVCLSLCVFVSPCVCPSVLLVFMYLSLSVCICVPRLSGRAPHRDRDKEEDTLRNSQRERRCRNKIGRDRERERENKTQRRSHT